MGCTDCGGVKQTRPDCEQRVTIDYVPNTACTIGVTFDGITDTIELKTAIQNCESKTDMVLNTETGCIEYSNEEYVSSDGQEGYKRVICATDLANYIKLGDLADVELDDRIDCSLLVFQRGNDCGPGCQSIGDKWVNWRPGDNMADDAQTIMGFNDSGCPVAVENDFLRKCTTDMLEDLGVTFPTGGDQDWKFPYLTIKDGCIAKATFDFNILKPLVTGTNSYWTEGEILLGGYPGELNGIVNDIDPPGRGAFPAGSHAMEYWYLDSTNGDNNNASKVRVQYRYDWAMVFNGSTNAFDITGTITFTDIFRERYSGDAGQMQTQWTLTYAGQQVYSATWGFSQYGQLPGFSQKTVNFAYSLAPGSETGDSNMVIIDNDPGVNPDKMRTGIRYKNTLS